MVTLPFVDSWSISDLIWYVALGEQSTDCYSWAPRAANVVVELLVFADGGKIIIPSSPGGEGLASGLYERFAGQVRQCLKLPSPVPESRRLTAISTTRAWALANADRIAKHLDLFFDPSSDQSADYKKW